MRSVHTRIPEIDYLLAAEAALDFVHIIIEIAETEAVKQRFVIPVLHLLHYNVPLYFRFGRIQRVFIEVS